MDTTYRGCALRLVGKDNVWTNDGHGRDRSTRTIEGDRSANIGVTLMRHRSFASSMRTLARAAAQAERARHQAEARQRAAAAREERQAAIRARADAKEATRAYIAARTEEVDELNHEIEDRGAAINCLLSGALKKRPAVPPSAVMEPFAAAIFNKAPWAAMPPNRRDQAFQAAPLSPLSRILPGATKRRQERESAAAARYMAAESAYQKTRRERAAALQEFNVAECTRRAAHSRKNEEIASFYRKLQDLDHESVLAHCKLAVERSLLEDPDALGVEVGYSPQSRHLVADLELPDISVVPTESGYRYIKASDRVESISRPPAKLKALYSHLLCQIALKCIDTIYRSNPPGVIDCLTLNGMLDTIDRSIGQRVRVCLLSVRVTADTFRSLNLAQVQPEQCLKSLRASVSRAPSELVPVKPIVELNMVDPRFVDTTDVMSGLDQRPNLMELSPTEFESLITSLFSAMGLDTRLTRASRDGGVDCVAFDSRPVLGGKVIIQAKRYKNTVGVSAVRDLFGAVHNEGASKGILVTTSG